MKICFFGHPAHLWSGSSKFFEDIIEDVGCVTYFRPDAITVDDDLRLAIESDYDLYVFFQFDFLAYPFIAAGKKVAIVPMVDGSASYGSQHWKLLREGNFVSFSPKLHNFLRLQGIRSFNITYWPIPLKYVPPTTESIYYWPRGHHGYISTLRILEATRNYPDLKLIVRASTDPKSSLDYSRVQSDRLEVITLESKVEHNLQIQQSSVFVAPRPSEGIGMSFLEAMSFGRAVLANNFPTMSDYIVNKRTGVFFPTANVSIAPGIQWARIGKSAHESVVIGHQEFIEKTPLLQDYLLAIKPSRHKFRIKEIHALIDVSCSVLKRDYFHTGKIRTLQNYVNLRKFLNL
jgi:hypothetical protein